MADFGSYLKFFFFLRFPKIMWLLDLDPDPELDPDPDLAADLDPDPDPYSIIPDPHPWVKVNKDKMDEILKW